MAKKVVEWVAEDGTRCSTEQEAKDYELRCHKLFLIRPLIAVELSQLCQEAQDAVARFIVKGGKALLEIMASDEPFTGEELSGQLGAGEEAQPGMCGATAARSHPKPGRGD